MRKMSEERRKLAAQAGSLAAMSGLGPIMLRDGHTWWHWGWNAFMAAMLIRVIVKLYQLQKVECCG